MLFRSVVALDEDSYEEIAKEFDLSARSLRSFNEVPKGFPLLRGNIVYLERKKSRANRDMPRFHRVAAEESMHEISQMYGIKIKNLYSMNKKTPEYVPMEGDEIRLR